MHFVVNLAIPVLVIFMMLVVGLALDLVDFQLVRKMPLLATVVLAAQTLALPLLAGILIHALHPEPGLAGGLILVAASPIAAISSYYSLLARGDAALAVTLTACSSALALLTLPLVAAAGFQVLVAQEVAIALPLGKTALQVLIGLVLPIIAGMTVRRFAPVWTQRHHRMLTRSSLAALALLVAYVVFDQAGVIIRGARELALAANLFTSATFGIGYALSWLLREGPAKRIAITIGFGIRNLSAAIMIGATVLGRLDFVAFGAMFFLTQLVLTIPLIFVSRRVMTTHSAPANDPQALSSS